MIEFESLQAWEGFIESQDYIRIMRELRNSRMHQLRREGLVPVPVLPGVAEAGRLATDRSCNAALPLPTVP